MPKPLDWAKIHAEYEAGTRVPLLAQRSNVKAAIIRERAQAENWGRNDGEEAYKAEQERKRERQLKRLAAAGALLAMPQEARAALIERLLTRYLRGETLYEMAQEHGADRNHLYLALLGGLDSDLHHDLITEALISRVGRADAQLEAAKTPAEIGRARELARFARMDLERRRPALYGQKQQITLDVNSDLGERLRRSRERVINPELTALPALELVTEDQGK